MNSENIEEIIANKDLLDCILGEKQYDSIRPEVVEVVKKARKQRKQ